MFVCSKKGRVGPCPIILYGYGGFNISLVPYFSSVRLFWLQHFGNYVIVNLRGGGEYGDAWHAAGKKLNKQNVFDDFIAASEYLVKEGYTTPEQITINGGSNGGLLVSACALQAPSNFGCVVSQVPVTDMLRYHKFTIGYAWISDYGDAGDTEEMFKYLYNYSPVHNVKPGVKLPSMLITTADHDDRVVPLHSFKLIASLQDVVGSDPTFSKPLMIRIETSAGHGAGKPVSKTIDEWVDIYSFIISAVNAEIEK
jgi:prolyl oligopeptidase